VPFAMLDHRHFLCYTIKTPKRVKGREISLKKLIVILIIMLYASACFASTQKTLEVRLTGYFPSGYKSKAQARIEGGKYDRYGNLLRTLQDYKVGSYVSCATDPRVIKSGTVFSIRELPDITFLACDVGSAIKGRKVDICVKSEKDTHVLPRKVTIIKEYELHDARMFCEQFHRIADARRKVTELWNNANLYIIQELARRNILAKNTTRTDVVWLDRISSTRAVSSSRIRYEQESLSRFRIHRYYQD